MHSTFDEGIAVGEKNGSKGICITHFSPRYIKNTPWIEEHFNNKILFTHDFLSFRLSQLGSVYQYSKIFTKVMDQLEKDEII